MSRGKKALIIAVPILLFAAVLTTMLIYHAVRITDYTTVATVAGMDISAGELRDQMQRSKPDVIEYYQDKYDVEINSAFWDTEFDGQTPTEYLRDYAMISVENYKIQQKLGMQYGELSDASYKAFVERLESENAERASKIAAGEVVYGAREYTKNTYYEYTLSNLAIALQNKMSEPGNPLEGNEQLYLEFYEKNRLEYYKKIDNYEFVVYSAAFTDDETKQQATELIQRVETMLRDGASDSEIESQIDGVKVTQLSMDHDNYTSIQKGNDEFYEMINPLRAGEQTEIFENQLEMRLVRCTSFSDAGCIDYDEIKNPLIAKYNQEKYDELVAQMCSEATPVLYDKYYKVR